MYGKRASFIPVKSSCRYPHSTSRIISLRGESFARDMPFLEFKISKEQYLRIASDSTLFENLIDVKLTVHNAEAAEVFIRLHANYPETFFLMGIRLASVLTPRYEFLEEKDLTLKILS